MAGFNVAKLEVDKADTTAAVWESSTWNGLSSVNDVQPSPCCCSCCSCCWSLCSEYCSQLCDDIFTRGEVWGSVLLDVSTPRLTEAPFDSKYLAWEMSPRPPSATTSVFCVAAPIDISLILLATSSKSVGHNSGRPSFIIRLSTPLSVAVDQSFPYPETSAASQATMVRPILKLLRGSVSVRVWPGCRLLSGGASSFLSSFLAL